MGYNSPLNTLPKIVPMKINEIENKIAESVMNGELSNHDLFQLMEHSADFLNLQKVSVYAQSNNMSKKGVYKCREVIDFRGFKYVVDNG
jgi:hypothetical protein